MPDDDLLVRADKHRTAGDGYLCIHCGERWPCTTTGLAAALRAAKDSEATAAVELDDIADYASSSHTARRVRNVAQSLRANISAPPPTREDDDD